MFFREILPGFFLVFDKFSDFAAFLIGELVGAIIVIGVLWLLFS